MSDENGIKMTLLTGKRCIVFRIFVIDFDRAATRNLFNTMILHPDIEAPVSKDDKNNIFKGKYLGFDLRRGRPSFKYRRYSRDFKKISDLLEAGPVEDYKRMITGDHLPTMIWENNPLRERILQNTNYDTNFTYLSPDLLHEYFPDAKIIISLRNPIER